MCDHPCTTKLTERSKAWCVSPSLQRRALYTQHSLTIVLPGSIHTLMMASNVSAKWSATGARQVSPDSRSIPTKTQAVARNLPQLHFRLPKQPSSVFTNLSRSSPPITTKKSRNEQLKMKLDIVLRQNCDQSATVWWPTQSSTRHWRIGEWRLTLNKSTDNNGQAT